MRILFVSGRYPPENGQNGFILSNVITAIKNKDYEVICLTKSKRADDFINISNYTDVIRIQEIDKWNTRVYQNHSKKNLFTYLFRSTYILLRKLWLLININKYPNVEPCMTKKLVATAIELHHLYKFDCVIGVFNPFSAVATAIALKKQFSDIACGAYYLDLLSGQNTPSFIPQCVFDYLCYRGEIKAFSQLDFIIMPKAGRNVYSHTKYNSVNNKIAYVDFPVFCSEAKYKSLKNRPIKSEISIVYAGTLDKEFRNPLYTLDILANVSQYLSEFVFHIYGGGNCFDIVEHFSKTSPYKVIVHGQVPRQEAVTAINEADVLINISNKTENMVPSKIFELFASGKPIINFVSNINDYSLKYFERYPGVFLMFEWESVEKQIEGLVQFLINESGKQYDIETIKHSYIENTPEYVAEAIVSIITDKMK